MKKLLSMLLCAVMTVTCIGAVPAHAASSDTRLRVGLTISGASTFAAPQLENVSGCKTGYTVGTVSGTARYLKEQQPSVHIAAVEPAASPLLSGGKAGPHGLMGIGANFVPKNFDRSAVDEIVPVREEDAYAAARLLVRAEGVLAGITAGAALWAAGELARRPEFAGKNIVVLLPDTGERYLSAPLFAE